MATILSFGGRNNGRTAVYRWCVETAALRGEHVHALAHDGQWCITYQPVGFLWVKVR